MFKHGIIRLTVLSALVLSGRSALAQSSSVSGLYQINAGSYSECCGIGGNDVRDSANNLRIDGTLGTLQGLCADVPNRFSHSIVVASLLPVGPAIKDLEREGTLLRFRFTGDPPNDYFVEFSESLSATNWLSLTNYRAKLQTIEAVAYDSLTNGPARFYRVRKQDCQCD